MPPFMRQVVHGQGMKQQENSECTGTGECAGDQITALQVVGPDLAREDLMRQFEGGLAKVRYELLKSLAETDPLQRGQLRSVLDLFDQRAVIFQHDFLEGVARARGSVNGDAASVGCKDFAPNRFPELALGAATGWGAMATLAIPAGTKGMLWWKTTVTVAMVIASALGIPVWMATVLVTGGGGAAGFFGLKKALAGKRRQTIRQAVMAWFDGDVAPALRAWAQERLEARP